MHPSDGGFEAEVRRDEQPGGARGGGRVALWGASVQNYQLFQNVRIFIFINTPLKYIF